MPHTKREHIYKINCLANELDASYHLAARKLEMTDSALIILYLLYEKGGSCALGEICRESWLSKQTVNSALRALERGEILYLTPSAGKAKNVNLTEKGKIYAEQTGGRILKAECDAFDTWSEEEIETYLSLMEKYNRAFQAQVEKL